MSPHTHLKTEELKPPLIFRPEEIQFVVITGLSGSGKGSALKTFEDLGYYCIDNLPIDLIPLFAELCVSSGAEFHQTAMVVDVREGTALRRFPKIYGQLRSMGVSTRLFFLEAATPILVRRYSETRRPHPLTARQAVSQSIAIERKKLRPIRALADAVIDTTTFTVHELRRTIMERFTEQKQHRPLHINTLSFGFRYGVPPMSDLVFDVRFLPNPNFVASYRERTGNDARVRRYVLSFKQTREFLNRLSDLLKFLIPQYVSEGKSYLTIAVGCTGGRHRSVVVANQLDQLFKALHYRTTLEHRDISQGGK
ncbi:MAG: RNase adapter RapZ [Acidobacteriia bacterium]|nr:RNase adapter RapZ [Terriglobia bacterium]